MSPAFTYQKAIPPRTPPKLILLDRDGVINQDVGSPGVLSPSQLHLLPNAAKAIAKFKRHSNVVLVTNQSCVGKGLLTQHGLDDIHETLQRMLLHEEENAVLDKLYICTSTKEDNDPRMKPNPGMIHEALKDFNIHHPKDAVFIGDNMTDMQAASSAGIDKILVSTGYGLGLMGYVAVEEPILVTDWDCGPFVYAKDVYAVCNWLYYGDYV